MTPHADHWIHQAPQHFVRALRREVRRLHEEGHHHTNYLLILFINSLETRRKDFPFEHLFPDIKGTLQRAMAQLIHGEPLVRGRIREIFQRWEGIRGMKRRAKRYLEVLQAHAA